MSSIFSWGIKQPMRGVFAAIVGLIIALGITLAFTMDTYMGVFTLWAMSVIPIEIVIGLGWNAKFPPTGSIKQPLHGLIILLFMFIIGTIANFAIKHLVGGGAYHPLTHLYAISVVILTFWAVIAFNMWPINKLPVPLNGFLTLVLVYLIMWGGYQLFDFSAVSYPTGVNPSPIGAVPFYSEGGDLGVFAALAPHGPFPWESAIACWFWGVMFLFVFASLDMWPFHRVKGLMKQPTLGIVLFVSCAILTAISYSIGVLAMHMEPLKFLLCGICFLFGLLMIMLAFQLWPGRKFKAPGGGLFNLVIAVIIAIIAYYGLEAFCSWHFGSEAFVYPNSIFSMANIMLGLTFPAWSMYTGFFDFWPLPSNKEN